MDSKIKIGITVGDINGIGLEVFIKTFGDKRILKMFTPILYGSEQVLAFHKDIIQLETFPCHITKDIEKINLEKVNVFNCWENEIQLELGKENIHAARCAKKSLDIAVDHLKSGIIDAIVTLPINKKTMDLDNFGYPGHTEYLTDKSETEESLMFLVHDDLRVGLVTNHIPIKDVATTVTKKLILRKIKIMTKTLKEDFGIQKPLIAVLGLNPHASDNGLLGTEENDVIRPAINEAKRQDFFVHGPFATDGFFGNGTYKNYDGILAMYHDQGLAPFKALSFGNGVNYTAGLSFIRTSPDHGTAYDLAGKDMANEASFKKALFLAKDIVNNRKQYFEDREDSIHDKYEKQKSSFK